MMNEEVTQTFRDGNRLSITRDEKRAIAKFLDALLPGMLYVKCGVCEQFTQVVTDRTKTVASPTEPKTRIILHVCKECV